MMFLQENLHRKMTASIIPLQHSHDLHIPQCTTTNHNTTASYNKAYAIRVVRAVIKRATSEANTQESSVLALEAWLTPRLEVTPLLHAASLHCIMSLLNAPAQTAGFARWCC